MHRKPGVIQKIIAPSIDLHVGLRPTASQMAALAL